MTFVVDDKGAVPPGTHIFYATYPAGPNRHPLDARETGIRVMIRVRNPDPHKNRIGNLGEPVDDALKFGLIVGRDPNGRD
jgi:hypothetical protein